jgi:hypothetical protein
MLATPTTFGTTGTNPAPNNKPMAKLIRYSDGTIDIIRIEGEAFLPDYSSLKDLKGPSPIQRMSPPDQKKRGPRHRKEK